MSYEKVIDQVIKLDSNSKESIENKFDTFSLLNNDKSSKGRFYDPFESFDKNNNFEGVISNETKDKNFNISSLIQNKKDEILSKF